jgi:hypothetical protein
MNKDFRLSWLCAFLMAALALLSCGHPTPPASTPSSNLSAADLAADCVNASAVVVVVVLHNIGAQNNEIAAPQLCPYNVNKGTVVLDSIKGSPTFGNITLGPKLSNHDLAYTSVHFYLHQDLAQHAWKSDPNESVWLADYPVPATHDSLPACEMSKGVVFNDPNTKREISFPLCDPPKDGYIWQYLLLLDKTINGVTVTAGIDPQIINKPPVLDQVR